MLKRHRIKLARILQIGVKSRDTLALRWALSALFIVVTLAALSGGLASVARAQTCDTGYGVCPDNLCYPMGSQCCNGGGACNAGYNCWRGTSSGNFCCPGGTTAPTTAIARRMASNIAAPAIIVSPAIAAAVAVAPNRPNRQAEPLDPGDPALLATK